MPTAKPRSNSPTSKRRAAPLLPDPSSPQVPWLTVRGARQHNLKNLDVAFPLGRFTCVTGVSGSGKSSLVNDILHARLARDLNGAVTEPGDHDRIDGTEYLDKVIAIDQAPIGRTPRSNPGTYIKLFDEIRALFAKLPDAKVRGYRPGRFSFNVPERKGGGRCEACEGNGANRIEMDFLADVWVDCPVCGGQRFNRETLQIRYKHKSIGDVLDLDVQQAIAHFDNVPRIRHMLQTLHDVGLDYIKIGQPSPTLSGGEAQRIKLARELVKKPSGRTLYVLDEPTTGLHFEDIRRLLAVLHGFVDAGNTVVVIEHNLDVIKTADWVIDLGPEGGEGGGELVATGTPETLAERECSDTGRALAEVLNGTPPAQPAAPALTAKRSRAAGLDAIRVTGAEEHNLKNLTLTVPRDQMTVCTGVSGSGKTSFAIDTVFTEGYRRYVESLSAYARQFLGQLTKPKVEHVEGLSPAIAIEQKAASKNPRSTVGTITEVYDYLRVLWARIGIPHCPETGARLVKHTVDEMLDAVMALPTGAPITLLAPVKLELGETFRGVLNRLKRGGYSRVRIDGTIQRVDEAALKDSPRRHRLEVVVDRTTVRQKSQGRIGEAIEHALAISDGLAVVHVEAVEVAEDNPATERNTFRTIAAQELRFSQKLACLSTGKVYDELGPQHFSFNGQLGWCETCEGLGMQRGAPEKVIITQPRKSLFDGAIAGWEKIYKRTAFGQLMLALCAALEVDPDTPLLDWTEEQKRILMFGTRGTWLDGDSAFAGLRFHWRGFYPTIDNATRNSWTFRHKLRNVVTEIPCVSCQGGRLRADAAAVEVAGRRLPDLCHQPLQQVLGFFRHLKLDSREQRIAGELLKEIRNRLQFLVDVGLEYLTLHRAAPTLSGGEAQRIRLASQIGSGLSGVLYVLDEPTIGLHPRDTQRLVKALHKLRDLGNTLLLVEHDREVIQSADRLIDFGPHAGAFGGEVVAEGTPQQFARRRSRPAAGHFSRSLTRAFLAGQTAIAIPSNRRPLPPWDPGLLRHLGSQPPEPAKRRRIAQRDANTPPWLTVHGARHHNLRDITVPFPLGCFSCVTGVSGSGKSSLVNDILWPHLAVELNNANLSVGAHERVTGVAALDKVINVDQSPIGTTPSSNPATYTGVFDWIRQLFARLPDSKVRGYTVNRFSFNRPGGRCDACEGYGQRRIEMHFMPDVWVECEVCHGRRYTPETLDIRYKGQNIADVLEMRVAAALEHFANVPKVRRMLQTLADVGLDYLQLGQPAPTLSGGEAQRVKLAAELGKPNTGQTLYILDEPTTGLHFEDVRKLLGVIHRLADLGNTVIVVEHNVDVIKSADWIVDLGPEAGAGGGHLVACGTPEALLAGEASTWAADLHPELKGEPPASHTAAILEPILAAGPYEERAWYDAEEHARIELEADKVGLGKIGREVKMPWQIDGRRWHLEQRTSRDAQPTRWEPAALEYVIELCEQIPDFASANWNSQASVEVTAPGAETWFLHALTGGEWLLELYFRVPPGTFDWIKLDDDLGLLTLDERDDLETYGDWARVDVRPRRDGLDAVVIYVHDRQEIDTPAFRRFIQEAATAYLEAIAPAGSGNGRGDRRKARR